MLSNSAELHVAPRNRKCHMVFQAHSKNFIRAGKNFMTVA